MIDCHVHSSFSFDSAMNPETACITAIERGLGGIAFTEHVDYDFPGYSEQDTVIDFDSYFKSAYFLNGKYGKNLKVLKGVEVGVQPHVTAPSLDIVRGFGFDYVIASVHVVKRVDPYKHEYFEGISKQQAYGSYLEEVVSMARSFPDYDVVGHIDYVARQAPYQDKSLKYCDHADLLDLLFQELAARGKGLEVNTALFRENTSKGTPPSFDINILRRFKELGGEIICMGSDSHSPEYLGHKFEYFSHIIKEAGFRYIAHFEGRTPVFESL